MLKKLKRKLDAGKIFIGVCIYVAFVFLNNAGALAEPFSSALYFALIHTGNGLLVCSILFIASFVFNLSITTVASALVVVVVLCVIYGVFARKKNLGVFSVVFLSASLIPYVLAGGVDFYKERFFAVAIITLLGGCFIPAVRAFTLKGFRRPENYEILSLAFLYVCIWAGGVKYVSVDGYKVFAVLALACLGAVNEGAESCAVSFVLALPVWIATKNPVLIPPFMLYGCVTYLLSAQKKPLLASVLLASELASAYLFGWYGEYSYVNLIYFCAPLLVFVLLPTSLFKRISVALAVASDKPLPRYEINRTRTIVSGRLYEISGTFREISDLFTALIKGENPFLYEDAIIEEIGNCCKACSFCTKCKALGFPDRSELIRLIAIAKGKGRLTAVDLPKKFSQRCAETGKILFAVNKYVSAYATEIERKRACKETRELVALQADGVAAALKGIAKGLSKTLSYRVEKENKLCRFLLKKGVNVQEVMIYGEGEATEVHVTVVHSAKEVSALPSINEFFKARFTATERYDITDKKTVYVFERACAYDCVFGVASMKKDGETACGDTHSLIRISRNKFMLALSDGMGSGDKARATSSASLSLIESLYRSGLPGEIALTTVNRLLSFAGEDNFTALDLGIISLDGLTCDFIKLGAPYGFILSRGGVKLIEGSSLPMGILSELKPSVCAENIYPGDVILFLSDGVTDAFGSSTDFADFLVATPTSNPQKLADKILREAFALYGNKAEDDMTVVACKIFSA